MRLSGWASRHGWTLAFGAVGLAIAVLRLVALDSVPPGLHSDEASVGYNAWAIAHHGVDEHGSSFPLFFEAFGEYKNPVYIYLLAPFTWFLPLTPATVRAPAALCGLITCLALALAACRATGSRPAAMATLVTAGLTPWAIIDARVGLEAPAFVLCLAVGVVCVARAFDDDAGCGWAWGAGFALAVGVFAYSSGRLSIALLIIVLAAFDRRWRSTGRGLRILFPVLAAYLVVAVYVSLHPTALTQRLAGISIQSDEPGPFILVARFARNYLTYTGVPFLFTHGDANLRYSTGFGGMFLVSSLPALAVGIGVCLRRRREPLAGFLLVLLLVSPIPAAVTNDGTPQSLRAVGMLPAALAITAYGWHAILPHLIRSRTLVIVAAAAAAVESGGFLVDLYSRYPDRALQDFDTGELTAVVDAHRLAAGHRVLLSSSLDQPYIEALFALRPTPPTPPVHAESSGDNVAYHDAVLRAVGMLEDSPERIRELADPGDVLVLAPYDRAPPGSTLLERVGVTYREGEIFPFGEPTTTTQVLVVLWRR